MVASGFYDGAVSHLADEIQRVRLRLRLRITIDRVSGRLPQRADLLDRGFITADAVDAALSDGDAPEASGNDIERWRRACAAHEEEMAHRLARSETVGVTLPLRRLAERSGLGPLARDLLSLAVVAELDGGVRRAIAYLQNDITRQTPDLELALELFCDGLRARLKARGELAPDAPLVRDGLFVLPPDALLDEASLLRMPLRPARRVVDLVAGLTSTDAVLQGAARLDRCPPGASPLDWMVFSEADRERYRAVVERVATSATGLSGEPPVLVLMGPEGVGKSALSWTLGQRLGRSVLRIAVGALERERLPPPFLFWPRAVREARLQDALLLVEGAEQLSAEELVSLARAVDRDPRLPVVIEARQPLAWAGGRPAQRLEMRLPAHGERASLWQIELGRRGLPVELAGPLAAKFRVTAGVVKRTLDEVAHMRPRREPVVGSPSASGFTEAVSQRLAENRDHRLGTLATRITSRPTWAELVLPPETVRDLERLSAHFRHRTKLMVDWGFERKMTTGQGISALFQGPPGTGKTMAASVIAGMFDLELFQIDLSRIVSKWLGETEKNLATIFDEAEKAHAILLFDEADSLFAKRTEVQSSNDRHANLEVNFLLQRMDRFQGITLLTSNLGSSIDEAFVRRLSFKIEFPAPTAVERARLWQVLSPPEMETDGTIDHAHLGARFEMSGGHIRNAIFRGAVSAAAEGVAVGLRHLVAAGNTEYRAIGKIVRTGDGER